jgi:hypothetical protein
MRVSCILCQTPFQNDQTSHAQRRRPTFEKLHDSAKESRHSVPQTPKLHKQMPSVHFAVLLPEPSASGSETEVAAVAVWARQPFVVAAAAVVVAESESETGRTTRARAGSAAPRSARSRKRRSESCT